MTYEGLEQRNAGRVVGEDVLAENEAGRGGRGDARQRAEREEEVGVGLRQRLDVVVQLDFLLLRQVRVALK